MVTYSVSAPFEFLSHISTHSYLSYVYLLLNEANKVFIDLLMANRDHMTTMVSVSEDDVNNYYISIYQIKW